MTSPSFCGMTMLRKGSLTLGSLMLTVCFSGLASGFSGGGGGGGAGKVIFTIVPSPGRNPKPDGQGFPLSAL